MATDKFVTDTHALFWYLTGDSKPGKNASKIFKKAAKGKACIVIPAIVLAGLY